MHQMENSDNLHNFRTKVAHKLSHMKEYDTGMINKTLLAVATELRGLPQHRKALSVWHEPELAQPIRTMWEHYKAYRNAA